MAIQVLTSLCSEYLVSPMSWSWQAELEGIFLHKHIKTNSTSGSTIKSCGEKLLCGGNTIGTATYNDARHNLLKNGAPLLINNMGDQRSAMKWVFGAVLLNLPTCAWCLPVLAGQHAMSVLTNVGQTMKSYTLFETTPLSWGSPVLGYKAHHPDKNVDKSCELSMGTCMQMSCAATSANVGTHSTDADGAFTAALGEKAFQFMGLETGRFFRWEAPSSLQERVLGGIFQVLMLAATGLQVLYVFWDCDSVKAAEYEDWHGFTTATFAGGYSCTERGQPIAIIGIVVWSASVIAILASIMAPLTLCGHTWYEWLLFWPPIATYLRYIKHWSILIPEEKKTRPKKKETDPNPEETSSKAEPTGSTSNPQQIFIADGGMWQSLLSTFTHLWNPSCVAWQVTMRIWEWFHCWDGNAQESVQSIVMLVEIWQMWRIWSILLR